MNLLNKNFNQHDRVVIKNYNSLLDGQIGAVIGKETKMTKFGLSDYYIVFLDNQPVGSRWSGIVIHEQFLDKKNNT